MSKIPLVRYITFLIFILDFCVYSLGKFSDSCSVFIIALLIESVNILASTELGYLD